jgi:hypothetical protein
MSCYILFYPCNCDVNYSLLICWLHLLVLCLSVSVNYLHKFIAVCVQKLEVCTIIVTTLRHNYRVISAKIFVIPCILTR